MKIDAVMSPCPYTIEADTPLDEAAQRMTSLGIRHLLVSDNGTLIGVLTDRPDKWSALRRSPGDSPLKAGDVCSDDFVIASPKIRVAEVCHEMADKKATCAILVDEEERTVGIFTTTDACRVLWMVLDKIEPVR
jgi:CBS domain-containing protein